MTRAALLAFLLVGCQTGPGDLSLDTVGEDFPHRWPQTIIIRCRTPGEIPWVGHTNDRLVVTCEPRPTADAGSAEMGSGAQ